jgi:hypothetical protein
MKKAFFTVVLLTLVTLVFAQQTRRAEVEVTYMIMGFISVTTEIVDARNERDAEIQVYNMYQLIFSVIDVNFIRWLPQERSAPQQQPQARQQPAQPQQQPQNQQIAPYIGTWKLEDDVTIIITNNEFRENVGSSVHTYFTINSWTAVSNTSDSAFPSGYLLTGSVSSQMNGFTGNSIYVYLSINGQYLMFSKGRPGGGGRFFKKQ